MNVYKFPSCLSDNNYKFANSFKLSVFKLWFRQTYLFSKKYEYKLSRSTKNNQTAQNLKEKIYKTFPYLNAYMLTTKFISFSNFLKKFVWYSL